MQQENGLTTQQYEKRLKKYGRNEIVRTHKVSAVKIFISQFVSPLILILIIAAIISVVISFIPGQGSNIFDTILILLIVVASGVSGFIQDYKSEKTIEALQKMNIPKIKVIRSNKEEEVNVTQIVPDDLILLESGDIVPADCKLIESFDMRVDESVLTGESRAIGKKLSDEIFMNTLVNSGTGKAIVLKTGMQTKVGKIASKLQTMKEEKTVFEKEISEFSKKTSYVILALTLLIFVISLARYNLYLSALTAISLAVAAIPEGLPAVVTLTLAVGANKMSKENALIRKLSVIESLGAVNIICTDKTGTLTKNEMAVTQIYLEDKIIDVSKLTKNDISDTLRKLMMCSILCNNSRIGSDQEKNKKYFGDQTEIAMIKLSEQFAFEKNILEKQYKKINEISFTSKRKMMSVIYEKQGRYQIYSKGAPEILIDRCNRIYKNGKVLTLDQKTKEKILTQNTNFASDALRVLGFAYKETKKQDDKMTEKDLIWLGLEAMTDPPREQVASALDECKQAQIRVIMLTGDNPLTAQAVAKQIGLDSEEIIDGPVIDKLNDIDLKQKIDSGVNIFARISPFHKLRILEVLEKSNTVAMTGDGVNDALALKRADVGIAMNIRGTQVAKEASDMILLDDNFSSITSAIKEGRRTFANIRKFVNYLFICNFAEVGVLLLGTIFLNLSEPLLLPIQILWINLLTDGFPALALGIDPASDGIMHEKPRKKNEPIINKQLGWMIGTIGIEKIIILFVTYFLILPFGGDIARSVLFTGFILYEFVRIAGIRHQDKMSWLANKWLLLALVGSVILQIVVTYTPINKYFSIVPFDFQGWIVILFGIIFGYFIAIYTTNIILKKVKN